MTASQPRLNLIVVRSQQPMRLVNFAQLLGVEFREEQHGGGPVHWAAEVQGVVLEIYPAKSSEQVDSSTRLGFQVADVTTLVESLSAAGVVILQDVKPSPWGLRAVVRDPDGRAVELSQPRH